MVKTARSPVGLPPAVRENPPIPFVSKVKKLDKADGGEVEKTELIKLEFLMDPANPASKYSRQFVIFKMFVQRSGSSG
jgi:hypothetical protein